MKTKTINFQASAAAQGTPAWRDSPEICALADQERHLGHIVQIGGRWFAFDATHSNEESKGFRNLGSFASMTSAKEAVELASGQGILEYAGAA
jgi:hypothetical protein